MQNRRYDAIFTPQVFFNIDKLLISFNFNIARYITNQS